MKAQLTTDPSRTKHAVHIGDLRVMLVHEDGCWFAQGLEIDYSAQGKTMDEAKNNFALGLKLTIREHLKMYGGIDRLLFAAPPDVWNEFATGVAVQRLFFNHSSTHDLLDVAAELKGRSFAFPYDKIKYFEQTAA
jgi:hypothetical protein